LLVERIAATKKIEVERIVRPACLSVAEGSRSNGFSTRWIS
jgi:hypothetical protein